jgi:hypothetical protein
MRKRVAAKVIYRAQLEEGGVYRDTTLDQAVDKLWRSVRRRGRWQGPGSRRLSRPQGVQFRPTSTG